MPRLLGKHQLRLLAGLGSPFLLLVVGDPCARSLARRGLLAPRSIGKDGKGAFFGITPAGLRLLADHLERGDLKQFEDPRFQQDRARLYVDGRAST